MTTLAGHTVSDLWMRYHFGAPLFLEADGEGDPRAREVLLPQLGQIMEELATRGELDSRLDQVTDGLMKRHKVIMAWVETGAESPQVRHAARAIALELNSRDPSLLSNQVNLKPASAVALARR